MQGRHVPDSADILLRDEDTIRNWLKAYQTDRLSSIFPDYAGNTNAKQAYARASRSGEADAPEGAEQRGRVAQRLLEREETEVIYPS